MKGRFKCTLCVNNLALLIQSGCGISHSAGAPFPPALAWSKRKTLEERASAVKRNAKLVA